MAREKSLIIKLNAEEKQAFTSACKSAGVSMSAKMRELIVAWCGEKR